MRHYFKSTQLKRVALWCCVTRIQQSQNDCSHFFSFFCFVSLPLWFWVWDFIWCVCVCSCGFGFVLTVQVSNANNSFWFQSEFKWLHIPSRCMGFDLYFVFTFYSLGSVRWIIFTCSPNYKSNTTPLLYRYIVWFVKRMINLLWVAHVTSSVWAFFAFFLYGKWKK